jgi:hypothetical protein
MSPAVSLADTATALSIIKATGVFCGVLVMVNVLSAVGPWPGKKKGRKVAEHLDNTREHVRNIY